MESVSAEQLHTLEQELKQYILQDSDLPAEPGETCFYQCPASAVQIRTAEISKMDCGSNVTNRKSISQLYKNGQLTGGPGMQRNVAEKYPGTFFITNERFFLLTAPRKLDLPLTDIFIINFYPDGFAVMARGRTYMVETLHANRIREFLQKNMLHISYYEQIAAGLAGTGLPAPGDTFDFYKLKLSLDLLCKKKTPAVAVMDLMPPLPQAESEAAESVQNLPNPLMKKKAADVVLWLLALFLAFYFVFPLLMELRLPDIQEIFSGNWNWGGGTYTVTTGDMQEIESDSLLTAPETE